MKRTTVNTVRAMLSRRAALAAALSAAVALPQPAAADSRVMAIGNPNGGVAFTARCEEGEFLTGLFYRAGNEFDAIAPICARAQRPSVVISDSVRIYPRMFGGEGGRADKMECGGGAPAIRSLHVDAMRTDQRVRAVSIYCGPVSAESWEMPAYPHAGYEGNLGEEHVDPLLWSLLVGKSTCPPGEVAVGIHGRSGARVDRLGLVCGTPVTQIGIAQSGPAYAPPGNVEVGDQPERRGGPIGLPTPTRPRPGGPVSTRPRPEPPR